MITVETPQKTTTHRKIEPAMFAAAKAWKAGATFLSVQGQYSAYRLERTSDGVYGMLTGNRCSSEVRVNADYWNSFAQRFGLPYPLTISNTRID